MNYVEAPDEFVGSGTAVFLAGGISDCENWQSQVARALQPIEATVLNPRRVLFPDHDEIENQRQIEWEYRQLRRADLVVFWFAPPTLCPIALFELGVCCASGKPIVVGADPQYARRFDLKTQIALHRPQVTIADSLEDFIVQIRNHAVVRRGSS